MSTQPNPEMRGCIENCLACYQACTSTLMGMCVESGGKHLEPEHVRLMSACAEICRASAHAMLCQATVHERICAACAEVCAKCAESCAALGGMDECVRACRDCAESCRAMSAPRAKAA